MSETVSEILSRLEETITELESGGFEDDTISNLKENVRDLKTLAVDFDTRLTALESA